MGFVELQSLSAGVDEGDARAAIAAEGGEERGMQRETYLEVVAFVLVVDQVGARQGDVVGEAGCVLVYMVAAAEHFSLKGLAGLFEGFHC